MTAFIAPTSFETPDFTLRCYEPQDAAILQEATNASYDHLKSVMPWATNTQTLDDARALTTMFKGKWLLGTDFVIAAVSPDGGTLLGGCGFHLRAGPIASERAEMGMWVHAAHARTGLGTKVLAAMLAWGFTQWPWRRLHWVCDARNAGSRRIAEKNHLRLEGTEREYMKALDGEYMDRLTYAVLKHEWQAGAGVSCSTSM